MSFRCFSHPAAALSLGLLAAGLQAGLAYAATPTSLADGSPSGHVAYSALADGAPSADRARTLLTAEVTPPEPPTLEQRATPSNPAGAGAGRDLTLPQALMLALERNLNMALAMEQVDEARGVLLEARSALGPSLALTASQANLTTNLRAQGFPAPQPGTPPLFPTLLGPFNSFDARLQFSQAIFNPLRSHLAEAEMHQVEVNRFQSETVRDQILVATALAYTDTQQQVATVESSAATLNLSKQLLALAQDQRKAGVATGVDVARAETRVAQDQFALTQARSLQAASLLRLKRVLGLPSGETIRLASPLEFVERPTPSADAAVLQALASRPEVKVLDQRVAAQEARLEAARSEGLPVVSLQAAVGPSGVTPAETVYLTRSVGIGVTIPLVTSGLLDAHRDQARSRLHTAQMQLEDARRQVEEDVNLALLAVQTSADQVRAARITVDLAERLLSLSRDRFQQGVADNLEVLDALTSLTAARSRLIEAIAASNAAHVNLSAALADIASLGL